LFVFNLLFPIVRIGTSLIAGFSIYRRLKYKVKRDLCTYFIVGFWQLSETFIKREVLSGRCLVDDFLFLYQRNRRLLCLCCYCFVACSG
jgi:hypothetical protein